MPAKPEGRSTTVKAGSCRGRPAGPARVTDTRRRRRAERARCREAAVSREASLPSRVRPAQRDRRDAPPRRAPGSRTRLGDTPSLGVYFRVGRFASAAAGRPDALGLAGGVSEGVRTCGRHGPARGPWRAGHVTVTRGRADGARRGTEPELASGARAAGGAAARKRRPAVDAAGGRTARARACGARPCGALGQARKGNRGSRIRAEQPALDGHDHPADNISIYLSIYLSI